MKALAAALALILTACATPAKHADTCATARQAAPWAAVVLNLACSTGQSDACDTAGLALKSANATMRAMCPR